MVDGCGEGAGEAGVVEGEEVRRWEGVGGREKRRWGRGRRERGGFG